MRCLPALPLDLLLRERIGRHVQATAVLAPSPCRAGLPPSSRRSYAALDHRRHPRAIPAPCWAAAAVVLAASPGRVRPPPPPRARPRVRPSRAISMSSRPPLPRAVLGEKKGRRRLREARVWLGEDRLAGLGLWGLARGFYSGEIFCGPTRQKQVDMQVGCPVDASGKGTAL
jgi:hypothetical protein